MEDDKIISIIVSGLFGLAFWFIKSQADRRYKEQSELKKQVDLNKNNIMENKVRDEANIAAFDTYKQTINGDFRKTEEILNKIWASIEKLNVSVGDLKIDIEKLKK